MNALQQRLRALGGPEEGGWSLQRRHDVARTVLAPVMAYPDQQAICRALSPSAVADNVAVYGTRRSGKTEVLARLCLASMLLYDHWVVRMCTNVLHAPTENILERRSDGGIVRLMDDIGLFPAAKLTRVGKKSIVEITLPWGSSWIVHDIGTVRAIKNKHGFTADLYWIDEATKTPLLELAIDQLIAPTLADSNAPVVLSYTPDEQLDTLPARVAQDPAQQWQRFHLRQWRNPHYGATFSERWARIVDQVIARSQVGYGLSDADVERFRALSEDECDAISLGKEDSELKGWVEGNKADGSEGLDPELLRNIFGRWVRYGARYVYKFHRVAPSSLYYCAASALWNEGGTLPVVGGSTREAMRQRLALLPDYPIVGGSFDWQVSIGSDIGTSPDPWTVTGRVWSYEHPIVYELDTRKEHGLDDDQMFENIVAFADDVLSIPGLSIYRVVADLSGMRKGTQLLWDSRIKRRYPRLRDIGVRSAPKYEKLPRIKVQNLDIVAGRHRYIAGGILDVEARNLRFKPDKPSEVDKQREVHVPGGGRQVPGDHGMDGCLYADHEIPILHGRTPDVPASKRLGFERQHYARQQQRNRR